MIEEDEILVDGQPAGGPIDVTGKAPPRAGSSWWPWLIGAGVLGALWWLTQEEQRRPFGRAGR